MRRVPSESMIFKQKPRPKNLDNPKAITSYRAENHSELPLDEDFKKVETMIGEFLKPLLAKLPYNVEMAGQILSRPTKYVSSSVPKDPSHPSGT